MYNEDAGLASAFTGYMNGTPPVTTADVNINLGGISALWRGATYQCKTVNSANKCTKIEIDWYREDQATNCSYGATLDPIYSAYGKTFCKLIVGN